MITITRTLDVGVCLDVLMNDEIFDSISEDGATVDDLKIDVIKDHWLRIDNDGELVGIVQFNQVFTNLYDCHINILPTQRKHSLESGAEILKWCKSNLSGSTLYTNVPSFCENVVAFLTKFGFEVTGKLPMSWTKNGKRNDMIILTRGV